MAEQSVRLIEDHGRYTVQMSHGANALDERLMTQLREALVWLADQGSPPLVLASAHPKLFCPGWDLKQLADADRGRVAEFLAAFDALVLELFSYSGPTIAAIAGHAVAGGCLLSLACDQRIMLAGRPRIGLSELALGVPVPRGSVLMLQARLAPAAFDELVFRGEGCAAARAVELGLVHRACSLHEFEGAIQRLLGAAPLQSRQAFAATKKFANEATWAAMATADEAATETFVKAWFEETTHTRIAELAARLGR